MEQLINEGLLVVAMLQGNNVEFFNISAMNGTFTILMWETTSTRTTLDQFGFDEFGYDEDSQQRRFSCEDYPHVVIVTANKNK